MKTDIFYSIFMGLLLFFQVGDSSANSALCNDLAKFSCAPGSYNDGTGVVKSETEVLTEVERFVLKSKNEVESQMQALIRNPQQTYFRNLAMSALGLQGAPTCVSQEASMKQQCEAALVEGLSKLANHIAMGALMPSHNLVRKGNLRDMNHILFHNQFKEITKFVTDKAHANLIDKQLVKKIKDKVFPGVREAMVERIRKMNISNEQRELMISKINGISFEGIDCNEPNVKNLVGGENVADQLQPDAFYSPSGNIFKFCAGYLLQSTSEFQFAMSVAHELAHSIDPCIISGGPEDFGFKYKNKKDFSAMHSEYPMGNVLKCLRTTSSIGAKNFVAEDNKITQQQQQYMAAALIAAQQALQALSAKQAAGGEPVSRDGVKVKASSPVALANYKMAGSVGGAVTKMKNPSFCDEDQIGESFSDWMAAEVLPEYISKNHSLTPEQYQLGYANARRLLCKVEKDEDKNRGRAVHPQIDERINRIIMVNPKIRSQMGCAPTHANIAYCDANTEYPDFNSDVVPDNSMGGIGVPPAVIPTPTPGVSR